MTSAPFASAQAAIPTEYLAHLKLTRDNFGIVPAQVAGAALLIGYILTVAVSVAAGSAAIASSVPALVDYKVPLSLFFIVLIAYGNLRGVRESGKVFAAPTFFFMLTMAILVVLAIACANVGHLLLVTMQARRREFALRAALGGFLGASHDVSSLPSVNGGNPVR